ncbi:hypothetical protein BD289DRAFT_215542 [Coniella lustricola]|uniref:Uncharacterized protein n=1 Tax=Coniella lustricola TaxID=2025994 RepID=A0A2T2ZS37_9PEZI|nr:hypothetical protein BD289DRAFT_215542 [Coniella lustricola]
MAGTWKRKRMRCVVGMCGMMVDWRSESPIIVVNKRSGRDGCGKIERHMDWDLACWHSCMHSIPLFMKTLEHLVIAIAIAVAATTTTTTTTTKQDGKYTRTWLSNLIIRRNDTPLSEYRREKIDMTILQQYAYLPLRLDLCSSCCCFYSEYAHSVSLLSPC